MFRIGAYGFSGGNGGSANGNILPFGNDTGVVNAYVATLNATPENTDGFTFEVRIKTGNDNTGASTLDIGLGAIAILDSDLDPIVAGMMEGDSIYLFTYNSTGAGSYQLLGLAKAEVISTCGYVRGGRNNYVSASAITIGTTSEKSCVQSSDQLDMIEWTGTLPIDITVAGIGGLDTGAEAPSTWYAVYCVKDTAGLVSGVFSASFSAPTLPVGYKYRRIGSVRNNSSSSFLNFICEEKGVQRRYWYISETFLNSQLTILSNGSATTITVISLTSLVPPTAGEINLLTHWSNFGGASADSFVLYPSGSPALVPPYSGRFGLVTPTSATRAISIMVMPVKSDRTIRYLVTNANDKLTIFAQAYLDIL